MEDKDFIFSDESKEIIGPFVEGDEVYINDEKYTISKFIKAKSVDDYLGFPSIYSWYLGKNSSGDDINLFFFDEDIDSVENNSRIAEKWWEESFRN